MGVVSIYIIKMKQIIIIIMMIDLLDSQFEEVHGIMVNNKYFSQPT